MKTYSRLPERNIPMNANLEKYIDLAEELQMTNARLISPDEIFFDIRAILKCRWGCDDFFQNSIRCHERNTTYEQRQAMIRRYSHILLVHAHNDVKLSHALLALERAAFLDGHYFAFAVRTCHLCTHCAVQEGETCPTPEKVRPCDQSFGIDVFKTVRHLGLPCEVLQGRDDLQNRYGFVLIE